MSHLVPAPASHGIPRVAMLGPSACGGSPRLATLRAGIAIGERVGDRDPVAWLCNLPDHALPAFAQRLWTSSHDRYDEGGDPPADSIVADRLAGQWWAGATGSGEVGPDAHLNLALRTNRA